VAIVLDRSGSMQGEKLERAKEAAIAAIDRLSSQDIVSVIAYDHQVRVLVPATRVSDTDQIRAAIRRLEAGGNTALFAGVSKGAAEARKFLDRQRVNRVILLSDGLANVGPDSPSELASLGLSLKKEGISVTTIGLGLGYHEDLMTRLASAADGNHAFVEHPRDLARIFDHEFGDVLSVVAQEVVVHIHCPTGVRPVRILGRNGEIVGSTAIVTLNQLYAEQEKYVLLELEVPGGRRGERRQLADVEVTYANMTTRSSDRVRGQASAFFTDQRDLVEKSENRDVMVAVVEQIATERNELALALRDQGKIQEAQRTLLDNAQYIEQNAAALDSESLQSLAEENVQQSEGLEGEEWERSRKQMRETQEKVKRQRTW
jgi:Ca-activated chloride channel family protein